MTSLPALPLNSEDGVARFVDRGANEKGAGCGLPQPQASICSMDCCPMERWRHPQVQAPSGAFANPGDGWRLEDALAE